MYRKSLLLAILVVFTAVSLKAVTLEEKTSSKGKKIAKEFHISQAQTLFTGKFILNLSDDIMTMSYVNKGLEKVTFRIEDEFGSLLFSNNAHKKAIVHHRLSTLDLPEGIYTAYVRVGNNFHEQTFKVEK